MGLNLSRHLPLFFVLLFPLLANGQIRQPRFDILTVENGLPENYPAVTLQDNLGYIWTGTPNGLVRYDGYDMKVYNLDIESRKFDRNYTAVFSLLNGMVRYDPAKARLTRVGYIQNSKGITKIYDASSQPGILWLMKKINGANNLVKFNPLTSRTSFYPINEKERLEIFEDKQKKLWIESNDAILHFDRKTGKFKTYQAKEKLIKIDSTTFIRMGENKDGALWAKTDKGLLYLPSKQGSCELARYTANSSEKGSLPYDIVSNMLIDRSGSEWFGACKFGLLKLNQSRSKLQYITETNKLNGYPGGSVVSMALLLNGSFPVCTTRGLYESNKTLSTYKPFPFKNIKGEAIKVERQGQVWISSEEGLTQYNTLTKKSKT